MVDDQVASPPIASLPRTSPPLTGSGTRLPTMSDVAAHAGVSRQLVSMVMRGVPGPAAAARDRVLKSAAELGFQPNQSARLLRQSRTRLIGAMFSLDNEFQARIMTRLLERARDKGYGVVMAPTTPSRSTELALSELLGHRIEALACFNPDPDAPTLSRMLDLMPVVWLGEKARDPRASSVHVDDDRGLTLAIEHLVGLGHRRITYVGGRDRAVGPDRARAYRDAMTAAGLAEEIDVVAAEFGPEDGASAAREILARSIRPTAVIACSDRSAAAIRVVLAQEGVAVPGEISIVGYDDSPVAALSFNVLTSVRQDVERTVDVTVESIEEQLANPHTVPHDIRMPATLTIRESTGPVRAIL